MRPRVVSSSIGRSSTTLVLVLVMACAHRRAPCRSVDAGQWSSVAGKRTPCDMTAQRRCECASCQAQSAGAKLKRCARCKEVFYCSVQCQRRSWTTHRACCSRAGLSKAPSCWRQLYRYNHDLLRNTFLDPALDHTLQQAYPRVSNFSMAA